MNTIFMNSENSKSSDPHRLLPNLTDKTDLKRKGKYIALSNLSIYSTWKDAKISYKNNKFKIWNEQFLKWNKEFELCDGSHSISDIHRYILKKHGEKTVNPSLRIHLNKIENRITFNSWNNEIIWKH